MINLDEAQKTEGNTTNQCTDAVAIADASDGNGMFRGKWRRYLLQGVLLTLAASFLVVTFTMDETWWSHLDDFPPRRAAMLAGIVALAWACNGLRTWTLARALGYPLRFVQAIGITLSMEFAIAATPGGVGGVASRIAFQRKAGLPLHISMTMIAADLSADLVFFLSIMPFALVSLGRMTAIHRIVGSVPWETLLFCSVSLIAATIAVVMLLRRDTWMRFASRHPRLARFRLAARWRTFTRRTNTELGRVWRSSVHLAKRRPLHYFAALVIACIQWMCRYGVLAIILYTFGVQVDLLALVVLQGLMFFVGLLVIAPGGGGSLEILSTLILKPLAGAQVAGLSVIIWRIFTYYLYVAAGGLAFVFLSTRRPRFWQRKALASEIPAA